MARGSAAARRPLQRTAVIMAIYLAGILGTKYLTEHAGVTGPLAVGCALVPGLAMAAMFYSTGKAIADTEDEFLRMLAVRQQLIAAGFVLSVASAWGTLEMFDLVPHVEAFYIVVLWALGVFVGMIANRVTHGVWGQCP
jgi:hypothetical protein